MIKYEDIINTAKEVMESEKIYAKGLTLEYVLPQRDHDKLNEELFYRTYDDGDLLNYMNIIELDVLEIRFKFIKEDEK